MFAPGDTIWVKTFDAERVEAIVMAVEPDEHWSGRLKLICAYINPRRQHWTQMWWHNTDPDVHPNPGNDALLTQWAAHTLIHGGPPIGLKI